MILPDDVLCIIREYSKPLLRFPGEYKKALMELGLRDWPEIRQKLCTSEAEPVIRKLQEYVLVYLECQVRLKEMNRPMYPRVLSGHRTEHAKYFKLREKLYRELQIMIQGEEVVVALEKKYRFELFGVIFE